MGKGIVTIPVKLGEYIEHGRDHYKTNHNVLAYALHRYSVNEKELSKERVLLLVDAVYNGYNTK